MNQDTQTQTQGSPEPAQGPWRWAPPRFRQALNWYLADIEAIRTHEGTETIQALLVGPVITGASAFG